MSQPWKFWSEAEVEEATEQPEDVWVAAARRQAAAQEEGGGCGGKAAEVVVLLVALGLLVGSLGGCAGEVNEALRVNACGMEVVLLVVLGGWLAGR